MTKKTFSKYTVKKPGFIRSKSKAKTCFFLGVIYPAHRLLGACTLIIGMQVVFLFCFVLFSRWLRILLLTLWCITVPRGPGSQIGPDPPLYNFLISSLSLSRLANSSVARVLIYETSANLIYFTGGLH